MGKELGGNKVLQQQVPDIQKKRIAKLTDIC
jgi:hypothetical protein